MSENLGKIESKKNVFTFYSRINKELTDKVFLYLISLIKENKKLKNYNEVIMSQENLIFNSKDFFYLSLKDILIYLQKFFYLEDYILIGALIYIERFCRNASIVLTEYNVHKLLFTSILIAIKEFEDFYYENSFYSRTLGINEKDLNKLEFIFVTTLDFKLYINKIEYQRFKAYIFEYN